MESLVNVQFAESEISQPLKFTDGMWKEMVERLSSLFSLEEKMKEKIVNQQLMKLIGALPFLAGCNYPMRIAMSHLSIFYMASSDACKDIFYHSFQDNESLFNRLERIMHFDEGNKQIIDKGLNMIALAMLADHFLDRETDLLNNKYNPLNSEVWNYEKLKNKLLTRIEAIDCPLLNDFFPLDRSVYGGWWR